MNSPHTTSSDLKEIFLNLQSLDESFVDNFKNVTLPPAIYQMSSDLALLDDKYRNYLTDHTIKIDTIVDLFQNLKQYFNYDCFKLVLQMFFARIEFFITTATYNEILPRFNESKRIIYNYLDFN